MDPSYSLAFRSFISCPLTCFSCSLFAFLLPRFLSLISYLVLRHASVVVNIRAGVNNFLYHTEWNLLSWSFRQAGFFASEKLFIIIIIFKYFPFLTLSYSVWTCLVYVLCSHMKVKLKTFIRKFNFYGIYS